MSEDVFICPVSFTQQRLWFLNQMDPDASAYNITPAISFVGSLDTVALEKSLNEIIARHEALRTTFAIQQGEPRQLISPALALAILLTDLSHLPDHDILPELRRLVHQEALLPFDLSRGPLLRARLFKLADQHHVLLLAMHHIISDGWSIGLLFKELTALYVAFAKHLPSPLADLPIQYADYALWQRQHLHGPALDEHLAYWSQQLSGAPARLDLPTDRPRPAVQS